MNKDRNKGKLITAAVFFLLLVTVLAACGSEQSQEAKKQFVVGFDSNYPPYGYLNEDGNYIGFDLELAEAVCDLQGWELKKQPIDWDEKDELLAEGTIDCIWNGFTITGREEQYAWSYPYINNQQVAIVKESSEIDSVSDLQGKTLAVQDASSALDTLVEDGLVDTAEMIVKCDDNRAAFKALTRDLVEAVIMDISVARFQAAYYEGDYRILDESLRDEQYGIGFRLEDTGLRDAVNESLLELKKNGIYEKLGEKYGISEYLCLE